MNSPYRVRQFLKTVLQQVYHLKVDVICRICRTSAYKYYKKQKYQYLHNSSIADMLREMHREVNTGRRFESRVHIDYSTKNHFFLISIQQVILIVASGLFSPEESQLDLEL